jgi:energy-coupling factor transporter ATP-binding protein EcfA2
LDYHYWYSSLCDYIDFRSIEIMAELVGDYPNIDKVKTPYWSLNKALSNAHSEGWPMTSVELTGFSGIGKSTLATSILGVVSEHYKKDMVYAPIEPIDRELLSDILDSVSFKQKCHIIAGQTDEDIIDSYCELLGDDKVCTGVFDSLTAISPIAEMESSSADMNMGRRARLAGVLARKLIHLNRFRTSPVTTIIISHVSTSMSTTPTNTGSSTTGGETKKNLSKVRIKLRKMPEPTMTEQDENAYVIEGLVEKYNFGKDKRKFYVVVLGGKGIHTGLTAMYDCKMLGICTFGRSITLGGVKYGSMKTMIEHAHSGNDEVFTPFIKALENPAGVGKAKADEEDEVFEAAE